MPLLKLDLNERQHIAIILDNSQGNPEDIETFHSLYDKVKLYPEEQEQIGYQAVDGILSWTRKPDMDKKDIEITLIEKRKLKTALSSWTHYRRADYEWLPGVLEQV